MAVYTEVAAETLRAFLGTYNIGTLEAFEGIAEGIENSNFLLKTSDSKYILTLFERRVQPKDLPWFLGLMKHLSQKGLNCPQPVEDQKGQALRELAGRPAAITTFLSGRAIEEIDEASCAAIGEALAQFHVLGADYKIERKNALSIEGWRPLFESCHGAGDDLSSGLTQEISKALLRLEKNWPQTDDLPRGQIHADLFPDNAFFQGKTVSGIIDFYFACTDFFAYDIAICLNAWCFKEDKTFLPTFAKAMIDGYEKVRPLERAEKEALPLLCQGAAIRFFLTRLYDWVNTPEGALVTKKDPLVYLTRLRYFSEVDHV
ncbi:homoserine kinase [Swingsia samuiensis]|uniref:Homoserine kinase n=1 Tax=Swingsia samuiensis TaxID=1293412 RepID=A0A4Y6UFH1_9PROT|nr:homoserine kinase [Swingsia samuiensis]QDH16289.1 homoserine kinase [Swingsia samuiensis]